MCYNIIRTDVRYSIMKASMFIKSMESYNRIIFLDTEMSGIDAQNDYIIRFKYVLCESEHVHRPTGFLITLPDGILLTDEISELVCISNEELIEQGKERAVAEDEIIDTLFQPNTLICTHHVEFDLRFIFEILYKKGKTELFHLSDYLDSLTIMRDKTGKRGRQSTLMRMLGIRRNKEDSLNIYKLFDRLYRKYGNLSEYINKAGDANGTKEIEDIVRA